jgi:HK97 gp10 family phage protein
MAIGKSYNRFPQIIAKLAGNSEAVVRLSAEQIARSAQDRVPRDTGALHDSIHTEDTDEGTYVVAGGDEGVFYGHMIEFGTVDSPAHPFLIPAAEAERDFLTSSFIGMLRRL